MTIDLENYRWRCGCCGEEQVGLPMAVACNEPGGWRSLDAATKSRSKMNSDLCIVKYADGHVDRFIRAVLQLPVPETGSTFDFGVWVSVSEASFDDYLEGWDTGTYSREGCFGYLCNELHEFPESTHLHADVEFPPADLRPLVYLHDADHPLVEAQRHGISLSLVEKIAAASMSH
ncbi:MAG: DUF2199 domain-containing protein [Rhizobiaceae bacterium]